MNKPEKIFTTHYVLLCLSSFLFFSSFNMLLPELPDYISTMGGADYKGLIIGAFTITAGFSRPFSGQLTDKVGRIPVMFFGAMVCVVCGFFYPLVHSVFLFLLLRLVHGFSTGFKPTGTAAYIADIVPNTRRGEAMGIYGFVTSLGMAAGPSLGNFIARQFSLDTLFYTSSAFAFLSVLILVKMDETLAKEKRVKFSLQLLKLKKQDLFYKSVWPVAVVVFLTSFGYGTVITLTPDLSKIVGLQNKGLYFTVFTISSLFVRITGGKVSDKYGRTNVIMVGGLILTLALLCTSIYTNVAYFIIGGILFGMAWGIISPSYQAWTVDLSAADARGRGIATMYIALEAGIGLGAVIPMFFYQNIATQIGHAFQFSAIFALLATLFIFWYKFYKK